MDPPTAWSSIGNSVRQMIADNAPGQEIQIAITEYNSYYTEPEELAIQTVNMLFLADTLGQLIDQGFVFANHWDILNNLTANGGDYGYLLKESANYRQPSYYVFPLWSRAGDQRIGSTVNRDAGTEMTVYASRHSASGSVNLVVINKTGEDQTGTVEISGFNAAGTIEAYVAQGDGLDDLSVAYNGDENPPIDLSTVDPIVITGISGTFTYTFPAYSVTSLTIQSVVNSQKVYFPIIMRGYIPRGMDIHRLVFLTGIIKQGENNETLAKSKLKKHPSMRHFLDPGYSGHLGWPADTHKSLIGRQRIRCALLLLLLYLFPPSRSKLFSVAS